MTEARDAAALIRAASGLSVAGMFHTQAVLRPAAPALVAEGRTQSYAELDARSDRVAQALAGLGLGRGDRVALLSENRAEYVELLLAASKLGVILACQNWRQADDELLHCIRLVAPVLAIVSARHAPALARIAHGVPRVLRLGEDYEALLAAAAAGRPADRTVPEDGLAILYTSGTTGLPKGALISNRAMVARGMVAVADWGCGRDDSFIAWTPLFHMGATDESLAALMHGGKVIVMDGFDAAALADLVGRERIGHLTVVPGVVDRMIAALRAGGVVPRGVKIVGVMADLVPRPLLAELTGLLGAPYGNTFGSTETGMPPASRALVPPGVVPARLSKQQNTLCEIRLVDTADREVPDGTPGEMTLRGPTLFSGYWAAEAVNREEFRGGWFHMGDVFVRNPDGTLDFVDRRKYLIKSGGENIYPAEVERVILALPGVADAVVVRRPDATWGEVPVAFVVRESETLTETDIIAACRGRIAGYKLPKQVVFVAADELPRSTSGKIQRHLLEQRLG